MILFPVLGQFPIVIRINYFKKIFKITSLIVLSTIIYACSEPKDKQITQQENQQSQTSLTVTKSIKQPTWNNINIKTISGHNNTIWSVAINPQKNLIASASEDKTIKLWNLQTGELVRTLTGHSVGVLSISFSPDGEQLASSSRKGIIKIWQVDTGKNIRTINANEKAVRSVFYSPDDKKIVNSSWDNTIKIWRCASRIGTPSS